MSDIKALHCVVVGLLASALPGVLSAQHQLGIGGRIVYLPITYGKGVHGASAAAGTVSISYFEPTRDVELQAAYTLNPRDSAALSPSLHLASLTMAWWPGPSSRVTPHVGGGFGIMRIVPVPIYCQEPLFCEGVPSFRRVTLLTMVVVGGVDISFGRLGIRADWRGHLPFGTGQHDDTENFRWETGVGLRYYF